MAKPLVATTVEGRVARITLRSPQTRNALSRKIIAELGRALDTVAADATVDVVLVDHDGPTFCSGGDLRLDATPEPMAVADLLHRLAWLQPVTVVRAAGAAVGAGLALVAAADVSVVAEDALFCLPEVRLGLVPGVSTAVVGDRIGLTTLLHLSLSGESFSGSQGASWGLFTLAVPVDRLDETVEGVLSALAAGSPSALASTKHLVRTMFGSRPDRRSLERAAIIAADIAGGEDAVEARAARAENRSPRWSRPDDPTET